MILFLFYQFIIIFSKKLILNTNYIYFIINSFNQKNKNNGKKMRT
jgi:hypothetical protein